MTVEPEIVDRGGKGPRRVGTQPSEQISDDVAEGGRDRGREDRPEQTGERPADDDREDHGGRVFVSRKDTPGTEMVVELRLSGPAVARTPALAGSTVA